MDRVFLDANILFSAAYRPTSRLLQLWSLPDVELLTSPYAVEEARRNLDLLEQKIRLDILLTQVAHTHIRLFERIDIDLPDKDRPILAAAIGSKSTHLLTGDVRHFGPYYGQMINGVLILPPSAYLKHSLGR